MSRSSPSVSPIDRLASHYEDDVITCPKCGYVDDDSSWKVKGDGRRIDYRHVCPGCGNIRIRTVTLESRPGR